MPNERPKKLQRISQACDLCHRRSIRCRPSAENPHQQCQNCYDFGVPCTYERPSRRRRNRSKSRVSPRNVHPSHQNLPSPYSPSIHVEGVAQKRHDQSRRTAGFGQITPSAYLPVPNETHPHHGVEFAWRSFAAASAPMINQHLRVYMDVVYPIFPLFHEQTLWNDMQQSRHLEDHGLLASIMAACALVAARSRDNVTEPKHRSSAGAASTANTFFHAARDAVFADPDRVTDSGHLRACVLLALTSLQSGQITAMHQYLGHYMTLSTMQRFHDEAAWPATLSTVEREERRRLYWSAYNLDILSSVAFDNTPKSQEVFSNVGYPSEAIDENSSTGASQEGEEPSWLRGWNAITDFHRFLEHAAKRLQKSKRAKLGQQAFDSLSGLEVVPDEQAMNHVLNSYYNLPPHLRDLNIVPARGKSQDIFGVQMINIQAVFQLVRIVLLTSIENSQAYQKCEVVEQAVVTLQNMSQSYPRAVSVFLIYSLAAIGQMLSSITQVAVAEDVYQRARTLTESLAEFVEKLESGIQVVPCASHNLRDVVVNMDQDMQIQRQRLSPIAVTQATSPLVQNPVHPKKGSHHLIAGARQLPKVQETRMSLDDFQLQRGMPSDWSWPFDFSQEPDGSTLSG